MSCVKPLLAFQIDTTSKGKKKLAFLSHISDYNTNGQIAYYKRKQVIIKDKWVTGPGISSELIQIPCNNCIGCRLEYSRQWAIRCMHEASMYRENYSLTLTYDEENVPRSIKIDNETGEVIPGKDFAGNNTLEYGQTLEPKHLTKFIKDLRRYFEYHYANVNGHPVKDEEQKYPNRWTIRMFACGEYGDKRGRPHYHPIIFNLPLAELEDLKPLRKSQSGAQLWYSSIIDKIWKRGLITVGECNWETCAYAARYVTKKIKGPGSKKLYDEMAQEPEFVRMSRNPGIGFEWYKKHKNNMYETDEMFLKNKNGVTALKPAKYYDRRYDIENPELMEEIKRKRAEHAKNAKKLMMEKMGYTEEEYNAIQERTMENKNKALFRLFERGTQ